MIVIVGGTHHNTLSMIRCFGMEGVKVDIILHDGIDDSYVLKSKYIQASHVVANEEEALKCLTDNYQSATVIACSDGFASLMDLKYEELHTQFSFFNCGRTGLLTEFMDKNLQTQIAKEAGFSVPTTLIHTIGEDVPIVKNYPCILKPLESINGGKKFLVCNNHDELIISLQKFDKGTNILIQDFIQKDYEIVVDGLSFGGKVIISGFIRKYRDFAGGTSYSSTHPIFLLPKSVVSSVEKIVHEMHYEGLFGVELMVRGDEYYFVEINLRNDATTYSLAKAGANLPYIYAKMKEGKAVDNTPVVKELYSMVEMRDVRFVLLRKLSLKSWWKDYKRAECKYYNDEYDPEPFRIAKKLFVKSICRKILSKIGL